LVLSSFKEHLYAVFGVKYFIGTHKAVDCLSLLRECFAKYGIQFSFIHVGVADGAGNVQNVCFENGVPTGKKLFPMRYCIHLLQTVILHALALKDYANDLPFDHAKELWKSVRKLLGHLAISSQGHDKVLNEQKLQIQTAQQLELTASSSSSTTLKKQLLPKSIPTLCETRWAGVYNCTGILSLPIVRSSIQRYCDGVVEAPNHAK